MGKNKDDLATKQRGLLYSLYVTPFVCIIGAWAYIIAGRYLEADKKAADAEALNEADIPPSSALDQMPPAGVSSDNSSGGVGGGSSNPPVNRVVVHDIYDHIQNQDTDSDDSYEEDNEDRRQLIPQPHHNVNKRTERIV